MLIQFLLQSIVSAYTLSYFTSPTFTTLEGWVSLPKNEGTQIETYDSLSYAGLNNEIKGLQTIIYQIPPHSYVRIRANIYYTSQKTFFLWLSIYADQRRIYRFQTAEFVDQIIKLDQTITHTSSTLFFLYSHARNDVTKSGIRDVIFDFYTCPVGCIRCKIAQEQMLCSSYQKLDFLLSESKLTTFNNDGWYFSDTNKAMNIQLCHPDLMIPLFGFFNKFDILTKMVILPPHYSIEIDILLLFIRQYDQPCLNTQIVIDDKYIGGDGSTYQLGGSSICQYFDDGFTKNEQFVDNTQRLQIRTRHRNRIMNFTIYHLQLYDTNELWALRDFQIYYKPCHTSCTQSCKGPFANDCIKDDFINVQLTEFFLENVLTDFEGWSIVSQYSYISICNSNQLIGGFNQLKGGQQLTYVQSNLSRHSTLSISLILYQIDSFNYELFQIFLNEVKIYEQTLAPLTEETGGRMCGLMDYDAKFNIEINNIRHSSSYAVLTFQTTVIQGVSSNGSWGIRNIKVIKDIFTLFTILDTKLKESLKGWEILTVPFKTSCAKGNFDFVGYFQQDRSFRKFIYNIPEHKQLFFQFKLIIVYNTLSSISKKIWMTVNQQIVWSQLFNMNSSNQACDTTYKSTIYKFDVFVSDISSEIQLELQSNFENTQKWGIRDLKIDLL